MYLAIGKFDEVALMRLTGVDSSRCPVIPRPQHLKHNGQPVPSRVTANESLSLPSAHDLPHSWLLIIRSRPANAPLPGCYHLRRSALYGKPDVVDDRRYCGRERDRSANKLSHSSHFVPTSTFRPVNNQTNHRQLQCLPYLFESIRDNLPAIFGCQQRPSFAFNPLRPQLVDQTRATLHLATTRRPRIQLPTPAFCSLDTCHPFTTSDYTVTRLLATSLQIPCDNSKLDTTSFLSKRQDRARVSDSDNMSSPRRRIETDVSCDSVHLQLRVRDTRANMYIGNRS